MNVINQSILKKARQKELQKLGTLLREAKAIRNLKESKSQKEIKNVYLSEANRVMERYASLLLLEFIEAKVAQAGKALHVVMNANNDNEIGRYLSSLELMKTVKTPGKRLVNVFDRLEQITKAEKKLGDITTTVPSQYSTRLSPSSLGPGVGSFRAFEEQALQEAIEEGLFDKISSFFGGKKEEEKPYTPKPNRFTFGGVPGQLTRAVKTPKGKAVDLTKEREELTDLVLKEEPKLVAFAIAYVSFFTQENFSDPAKINQMMKVKPIIGSQIESLINKKFGKLKGFNTKQFTKEIMANPDLIQTNLELSSRYSEVFMAIDEVMQGIVSGMKRGFAQTYGGIFSDLGSTVRNAE